MIPPTLKLWLTLASTLVLFACYPEKKDDLLSICNAMPDVCEQFHDIGDCRYKRTDLIRALYYKNLDPKKSSSPALLEALEAYEACLEPRLFIEFSKRKERKTQRIENYLHTQKLIDEELIKSKGTKDPHLAYYLWTHYKDIVAKKVFLKAANNPNLNDISLLTKLANFHYKRHPQKALKIFYKVLQQSQSLDDISIDVFSYIMTIYYSNKQFEQAYIWASILHKVDSDEEYSVDFELILHRGLRNSSRKIKHQDKLQEKADKYFLLLEQGNFDLNVSRK